MAQCKNNASDELALASKFLWIHSSLHAYRLGLVSETEFHIDIVIN